MIGDPGRLAARDLVKVHPVRIEKAAMEELHLERQLFTMPERAFRQKSDGAVVVVIQVLQIVRQFVVRRLERLGGGVPGYLSNDRRIEGQRFRMYRPQQIA